MNNSTYIWNSEILGVLHLVVLRNPKNRHYFLDAVKDGGQDSEWPKFGMAQILNLKINVGYNVNKAILWEILK